VGQRSLLCGRRATTRLMSSGRAANTTALGRFRSGCSPMHSLLVRADHAPQCDPAAWTEMVAGRHALPSSADKQSPLHRNSHPGAARPGAFDSYEVGRHREVCSTPREAEVGRRATQTSRSAPLELEVRRGKTHLETSLLRASALVLVSTAGLAAFAALATLAAGLAALDCRRGRESERG